MTDLSQLPQQQYTSWAKQFYDAAIIHEKEDMLARQLEAGKSVVFSEMLNELKKEALESGDRFIRSQAETDIYASEEYKSYLRKMHNARHRSNMAKLDKEAIKMQFSEWMCKNANARDENKYTTNLGA